MSAHLPYGAHRSRLDLAAVLPVPAPLALLVDPASVCNFRCTFCPTADPALLAAVGRPQGLMAWELYEKIIADLGAFPQPLKALHLYKDGEPLLHPRLPEMVALARKHRVATTIETTSNGARLTPALSAALIAAGLDGIRISVYGPDAAAYQRTTGRAAFVTVLDHVRALRQARDAAGASLHIHAKMLDSGLTVAERQAFLDAFTPWCDSVYVHPLHGQALADPAFAQVPAATRNVCSEPFLKLAINADGQVSACCADWNRAAVVGDVRREHLIDIWHGAALHRFRLMHLCGQRLSLPSCRSCAYIATLPADNDLDPVAEILLSRYHKFYYVYPQQAGTRERETSRHESVTVYGPTMSAGETECAQDGDVLSRDI